jgi:hypothetical protein
MTISECRRRLFRSETPSVDPVAAVWTALTRNEELWIEVIRQASRDADPPPTWDRVRKLRAIFRD